MLRNSDDDRHADPELEHPYPQGWVHRVSASRFFLLKANSKDPSASKDKKTVGGPDPRYPARPQKHVLHCDLKYMEEGKALVATRVIATHIAAELEVTGGVREKHRTPRVAPGPSFRVSLKVRRTKTLGLIRLIPESVFVQFWRRSSGARGLDIAWGADTS